MFEAPDFHDYCICFVDEPSNRELAEKLILAVSNYKLPRKVKDSEAEPSYKKGCILPLSRDGHLTTDQESLLKSSGWLMVICTKRARDAISIRQAIRFYISLKGRSFILPVLLEGEPQDAFPPEFFEERTTSVTFQDGEVQDITEIIEPLAIDVRARDLKASISLLRHIRIKVVAALIGVSYDTLEQRHEKRARRRLKILAAVGLSVPLALGTFFTYLWFNSQHQVNIAIKKTQVSKDLLASMCQTYPDLFKDIPEAKPIVNTLLIDSLEKLRVAESAYIPLLHVDDLLVLNDTDNLDQTLKKAKVLRYLEKKDEAAKAYEKAAGMLEKYNDIFKSASRLFAEKASITEYPCGVLIGSIDPEVSKACGGLQQGDIIVETKGFKFRSYEQYELYLFSTLPPDKVTEITVLRPQDGTLNEMKLKLVPDDLKFEGQEM